jgi:LmbE family N-acetylglucosaminyl deacetylase
MYPVFRLRVAAVLLGAALFAAPALAQKPPPAANAPVLLLFAHPDDEIIVAPLAAGLARRGIPVILALATAGENGAPADGSIKAGPALAEIRRAEAQCSAAALGVVGPIFLGFVDGSLGEAVRPSASRLTAVANSIRALVADTQPRAVITWGPDGGYGHPDHRLISAVASEIMLGSAAMPPLFYVGLPADALAAHPARIGGWLGTDPALLTVAIPFTDADAVATRRAAQCHKSQFQNDVVVDALLGELTPVLAGKVHLRPARADSGNPFE